MRVQASRKLPRSWLASISNWAAPVEASVTCIATRVGRSHCSSKTHLKMILRSPELTEAAGKRATGVDWRCSKSWTRTVYTLEAASRWVLITCNAEIMHALLCAVISQPCSFACCSHLWLPNQPKDPAAMYLLQEGPCPSRKLSAPVEQAGRRPC